MTDPLVGVMLGKYEVQRRLAEGGMATVYLARDTILDRLVAVKVLPPDLAEEVDYRKRFMREAQASAHLSHPNIVQVYDTGCEEGVYFFAMEYVDGPSVGTLLRERGWFDEAEALRIVRQAALGLGYVHRHGIVHRDIKPDNLLLAKDHAVRITDLGLVRWKTAESETNLTKTGAAVGTPFYISPEQISGRKDLDAQADVYSLGITLYHMLAGRPPFNLGTAPEIMAQHLSNPPPPVQQFNPAISPPTADLVMRMIAKDRQDRLPSMDAVVRAIDNINSGAAFRVLTLREHSLGFKVCGFGLSFLVLLAALVIVRNEWFWAIEKEIVGSANPPRVPRASAPAPAAAEPMEKEKTLVAAANRGDSTAVKSLLQQGARPNLFGAAAIGDTELMDALLKRDHNPNERFADGMTPLMVAAKHGQTAAVEMLLKHGAAAGTRDPRNRQALDYARESKHLPTIKALQPADGK